MKKGVYLLPTSLTLCSMFFGFYSILASLEGNYVHAAWAIMIATIFDGLDGWVARLTHSTTKFGIELASLSDLVAFGVAALVIFYHEMWETTPDKNYLILLLTVFLSVLMVSTLKFHGAKELNLGRRKPFSILVAIVIVFAFIVVHPQIALFLFAMLYLIGGIIENIVLFYRKKKRMSRTGVSE